MRNYILILALAFLTGTLNTVAEADTTMTVDTKCPICLTEYTATLDASGYKEDLRLDLKPLGHIAAPFKLPVCPTCHFVLYQPEFTKERLALYKNYVYSTEYKKFAAERSSHFLLGKLFEKAQKDATSLGTVYLQASWQEENHPARYREDLMLSLRFWNRHLTQITPADEKWIQVQLISAEIERLLGKFGEAEARLTKLRELPAVGSNEWFQKIINFEEKLVKEKDAGHHTFSEVRRYYK